MAGLTTTLVVQFATASTSAAELRAEIDARENGLNSGRTSFAPGDPVYYLVYAYKASITNQYASDGSISSAGSGLARNTEYIAFANTQDATTAYPISSIVSATWIGTRSGGTVSAQGGTAIRCATNPLSGMLKIVYDAAYSAYRLSGVGLTTEQALVTILGEETS